MNKSECKYTHLWICLIWVQLSGSSGSSYRESKQEGWVRGAVLTTEHLLVEMTYSSQNGTSLAVVIKSTIWISAWNSQTPVTNKSVCIPIYFQITFDEVIQKEINNFSRKYVPLLLQWELQDEASLKENLHRVFLFYVPINDNLEEDFPPEATSG